MKPPARALALSLVSLAAIAAAVPAHADRGGYVHRGGHVVHHGHRHVHVHRHVHHRGHGGIWGPLIVGGLVGAAIVGASSAHAQPVQPVLMPVAPPLSSHLIVAPTVPPVVVAPPQVVPPRVQYFCAPYRAYYPFVTNCPEPWHVMPY